MNPAVRATITPRAVLLGLVILPLNAMWLAEIEYVRYSDTPTIPQVFFHCVATLLLLTVVNWLVARVAPQVALSRGELLTIYAMQAIGSNICGHDQLQILMTVLVYIYARATPENQWATVIQPHVPRHLVVVNEAALRDLFRGHSSLYVNHHWRAFAGPLLTWTLVVWTIAATLYCLASLLRRQWDHERLTYPLTEIPLTVGDPALALFRAPVFWAGFTLAAGLQFMNLAHQIQPAVPGLQIGVTNLSFGQRPWSFLGPIPICYYPFAFGLAFLLPTNLGFSVAFFFLLTRLEMVVGGELGYTQYNGPPYLHQQASGAFVGFGLVTLWMARHHLAETLRIAWHGGDDREEPLSYRAAWLGLVGGSGLLLAFFSQELGMRLVVAAGYWVLLLLIILAVARVRAEVGLPSIELFHRGADEMIRRTLGVGGCKPNELVAFTLLYWMNRTQRNYNLQHQQDGLRLADRAQLDRRRFTQVAALATLLAVPLAWWAMLHVTYQVGLEGARFTGPAPGSFGMDPWQRLGWSLQNPEPVDHGHVWAYVFGTVVCMALVAARNRFVWWPLHPAGWVVADSFALLRLWVPLTLSWALKSLLLKYGGLRAYRRVLPFFVGLVVGEFGAGFVRTLVDLAWGLHLPANSGIGGL